jgi:four helix bundle protein
VKVKRGSDIGPKRGLGEFGAHRKAIELFDLVVADIAPLASRFELGKLVAQQLASADSVAANIEEGFGRGSKKDYAHFLVMARGSAQETLGRSQRLAHWLKPSVVAKHKALCEEIIAILTATIHTLRSAAP